MSMHLDFAQLAAFVAVADHGGVAPAADKLHLTQSAVTKRLQALEARSGQVLMDRVGRRLQPTEAGETLLVHARRILSEVRATEHALNTLQTPDSPLSGQLRIATSHHIGLHRLPPMLRRFVGAHPSVDLRIDFVDSEDGCRAVDRGDIELAVVTLPKRAEAWPQLCLQPVWKDQLVCVVGVDHPLANTPPRSLIQLAAHQAVLPDARTFTHRVVAEALDRAGVNLQIRMQTNYLETIKMLVGIGLGWSALPETMLDDSLVPLPVALGASRDLGVVTHRRRTLSRSAAALRALVTSH